MEKDQLQTINDRIRYVIQHEGHTVATFARKCGVSDGTLRNMLTRGNKPGYDLTVAILQAVNQPWCDANWLLLGQTTTPEPQDQDARRLLRIVAEQQKAIADQQHTIEEQRRRIDQLTDRLLPTEK